MKIILEAFGKMRSGTLDVPENTGATFKMALHQPLMAILGYRGKNIGEIPPLHTICEFEWTGKLYASGDNPWPRIYVLKDIVKQ